MQIRNDLRATGQYEALALLEIDCVDAVKVLLRRGSTRLRVAIAAAALDQPTVLKAA
jgi:hypothetical protein